MLSTNQPNNANSSLSSKFVNLFRVDKHKIKSTNSIKRSLTSKVSAATFSHSSIAKTIAPKRSKSLTDDSNEIKKNRRNGTIFDIQNWVVDDDNDEFSKKDLIPSVLFSKNDICELSVISKTSCKSSLQKEPIKMNNVKDSCLEGTYIVRGSIEHFAYIRTLRKIRERQRPLYQTVTLNSRINKLSETYEFPEFQREELRQYKIRVYEISKRNFSCGNSNYNAIKSTTTLCASESKRIDTTATIKNKLNAFLAECHVGSPIVMKYRPSYASTKVVTVFDDKLNQLVVRDLPLARKKRRLSKSSISSNTNTLIRTSSSNSSTSSLSSLTTLNDSCETIKFFGDTLEFTPMFKGLSTFPNVNVKQSNEIYENNNDEDEGVDEEDNVPLFVLKEQFKYSGRGCGTTSQKSSSLIVGENGGRLTLTV